MFTFLFVKIFLNHYFIVRIYYFTFAMWPQVEIYNNNIFFLGKYGQHIIWFFFVAWIVWEIYVIGILQYLINWLVIIFSF